MRTILGYAALLACTLFYGGFIVVATLLGMKPKAHGYMESFPRRFSRWVLRGAGVRLTVRGEEHIGHDEPRVYVSNHVSWFDVFALASVIPRYRFVAKKELQKVPIFGRAAGHVAAIYIDRQNRSAAFDAYEAAAQRVRDGLSVAVYPEGTRGTSYSLRSFKKGPFVLAIAAQVPIVPVIVFGTREVQRKGAWDIHGGKVELTFLEPVSTTGLTYSDRDAVMRTVWSRMAAELERHHGVSSDPRVIDSASGAA